MVTFPSNAFFDDNVEITVESILICNYSENVSPNI